MPDQAHHLRQLARASVQADATLAPGGPVITLSGVQQAAGTTTAACGLARELTRLGKQVILIDANLERPSVASHLRPDQSCSDLRGTLAHIVEGTRRAVEVLAPAAEEGLRFIAGCDADADAPLNAEAADRFAAEVAALTRQVDLVLIDAGHGMNAWIDRLWQLSSDVLLVSPPTTQGLLDGYAAAKLSQYHRHDGKLRLLMTRVDYESEASPLADRFAQTCQRFLNIKPKPATTLPNFAESPPSAQRQQARETFDRAVRLLAADLTAEIRVASLRLIRPTLPRQATRSMTL